jgi:polysaccharide transporter, PST family
VNAASPGAQTEKDSNKAAPAVPAAGPSLGTRVFQNTAAQLIGRVISIGLSGATSILLARFLGKEKLGEYGAIYAYLALYGFLASFCLEQILAREISVRRSQGAEIFRTGTLTALGFSLAGLFIAPVAAPLFGYSGSLRWLIAVAAVDALILPPLRFSGIIFQVEMRLWYNVVIALVRQALWLAAVVLLAFRNAAFYEVIVARTMVGILEAAIVVWTVKRVGFVQGKPRFIASEAKMMVREGFPLVLMTVAVSIYHRIDQVMLHKMSGDQVLGPYVIAVQLTELFSALPVALMTSLFPALAQSANDEKRFGRYMEETYRFLMVVAFAACALVTPIAAPVVELLYGKQFLPTSNLLIVLIWSEVPLFFGVAMGNALIAKGLQKYTPYGAIPGAIANFLLNLVLIPRYGALGAAWATVVSYCVANVLSMLFIKNVRAIVVSGMKVAAWPFVLAVGITYGLRLVPLAFWWKLPIAAISFTAGAWVTGSIKREDVDRLSRMFRFRTT